MGKTVKKKAAKVRLTPREILVGEEIDTVRSILRAGGTDRREWLLIPSQTEKVSDQDFVRSVAQARVKLRHSIWEDAARDARELSGAGGVYRVSIVSILDTRRVTMLAQYDNGNAVKKD